MSHDTKHSALETRILQAIHAFKEYTLLEPIAIRMNDNTACFLQAAPSCLLAPFGCFFAGIRWHPDNSLADGEFLLVPPTKRLGPRPQ